MPATIPPGTAAVGGGNPPVDMNNVAAVLAQLTGLPPGTTLPAAYSILGAAGSVSIIDNAKINLSSATASTAGTSRLVSTVGIKASGLQLVYANWTSKYTSPSNIVDLDNTAGGTITFNASIEVVATGTIYRVTFGGRTTATLDAGGTLISDRVALDVNAGDQIAVRTYLASGTAYVGRSVRSVLGGGWTTPTDLTAPGSGAVASATAYVYGPVTIIGVPAAATVPPPSVLGQGQSIMAGILDGQSGGDGGYLPGYPWTSSGGYLLRAVSGVGGCINISLAADNAQQFVQASGHNRRMTLGGLCKYAICEYGINDIGAGSRTPVQLQTDLLTIATVNSRYGIVQTWLTTILPNTTSTDGWITTANQTVTAWEANRVTHNTWVRAGGPISPTTFLPVAAGTGGALLFGQAGHPVAGYFETAGTVETALNSGLWLPADQVVTDAAITSAGLTLTCATSHPFVNSNLPAGSLGKEVAIVGAGAAGAVMTGNYISAFTSTSVVTLNGTAAGTTVASATCGIGITSYDGLHPSAKGHQLIAAAINLSLLV